MKHWCRLVAPCGLGVTKQVEGDAGAEVFLGVDAVDCLLPLTVTAVTAFHGVGGRRQSLIVKEREGLFPVGAEEFVESLAELLEAPHPVA